MSSTDIPVVADVKYWQKRWETSQTGWHLQDVNPELEKNIERLLTPNSESKNPKKVFVPLCGKTRDIAYLLSKGFQVFGLEGVKQPIEELDKENGFNLKFDESTLIYHTEDNQLQIYCGDLFECPIEKWGPFDCVWDRGSFIAVDYVDREKYKEMMQRSLRVSQSGYHNFVYLMEALRYNREAYPGPPRTVDEEDLQKYFLDWTDVEVLSTGPMKNRAIAEAVGPGAPCATFVFLFTPKKL